MVKKKYWNSRRSNGYCKSAGRKRRHDFKCQRCRPGTGSGILAIYAAKIGANKIDAYDIDPVAVKVAKDNIAENGVSDKIFCDVSDLMQNADKTREKYDFICANIVADIVIRLSECMGDYVKKDGLCAVSGIIDTQYDRVVNAISEKGFVLIDELKENDWCAFVFKRV